MKLKELNNKNLLLFKQGDFTLWINFPKCEITIDKGILSFDSNNNKFSIPTKDLIVEKIPKEYLKIVEATINRKIVKGFMLLFNNDKITILEGKTNDI